MSHDITTIVAYIIVFAFGIVIGMQIKGEPKKDKEWKS